MSGLRERVAAVLHAEMFEGRDGDYDLSAYAIADKVIAAVVVNEDQGERMVTETKSYPDFLDDMGKLLQAAMPRTDRERDELYAAEAEVRRLRSQLAVAEERRDLAKQRYDRERALLMEMFDTWKSEVMSLTDDGETPIRMIPEMGTATLNA